MLPGDMGGAAVLMRPHAALTFHNLLKFQGLDASYGLGTAVRERADASLTRPLSRK